MSSNNIYPFLIEPVLHAKVWGSRKLETILHKALPTNQPYGESWELHDTVKISNGPLAGTEIGTLLSSYGHDMLGPNNDPADGLPLLAKFIDSGDWSSVQVHPDDAQARELENDPRGKTDGYYIIDSQSDSRMVIGVQPGTTRQELENAISNNSLEDLLEYAKLNPGDAVIIDPGTIHTVSGGVLLYEIQQSSNTTYRLYDWGRVGLDGKPRELHIDKALQVSNLATLPGIVNTKNQTDQILTVLHGKHFKTILYQLNKDTGEQIDLDTNQHFFHIITCINGNVKVIYLDGTINIHTGQTVFIPANQGAYKLVGKGNILNSHQTT